METNFQRIEQAVHENYGDMDIKIAHRFSGDKVQFNQWIPGQVAGLVNDIVLASPRWAGRGGKSAFVAHALYLAARMELAVLSDPPAIVVDELERLARDHDTMVVIERIKQDDSLLNEIDKVAADVEGEMVERFLDSAKRLAESAHLGRQKAKAKQLVAILTARL